MKTEPVKSILEFYAGQSVLITGATGFLGKVLIEKILRSCPDVYEIFLLIRPKKGESINDRLKNILKLPIYDRLREEQRSNFKKLIPIFGDTKEKNLGLSDVDRQMLIDRVSIIIHGAASVRFNDNIKHAIFTNTRATRNICILAQSIKNLIALVYISTAFMSPNIPVLEEKVYPPITNWQKMIEVAESLDEHTLNIFTSKCLAYAPNAYIFSKNLAENVIQNYSSSLPCAIVKSSMVFLSIKEPFPGWLDNIYGPIGFYIGSGKGILRVFYNNNQKIEDIVPVDIVIKAIIVVSWKLGTATYTPSSTFVLNCTCQKHLMYKYYSETLWIESIDISFQKRIWYNTKGLCFDNYTVYFIFMILLHMLPALIIDTILKLSGHQSILAQLQKNVFVVTHAIGYFACNEWKFSDTNSRAVLSSLPPNDRENFHFNYADCDYKEYLTNAFIGAKKFLLNENMNKLNETKAYHKRINFIAKILNNIVIISLLWMAYKWFNY